MSAVRPFVQARYPAAKSVAVGSVEAVERSLLVAVEATAFAKSSPEARSQLDSALYSVQAALALLRAL